MLKLILFLVVLQVPASVLARIGETPEQCKQRYGTPVAAHRNRLVFDKNEFQIDVSFDKSNRVERISYSAKRNLTEEEIQTFLKANADESWSVVSSANPRKFRAPQLQLTAEITELDSLAIDTDEVIEREAAGIRKLEKEAEEITRGF